MTTPTKEIAVSERIERLKYLRDRGTTTERERAALTAGMEALERDMDLKQQLAEQISEIDADIEAKQEELYGDGEADNPEDDPAHPSNYFPGESPGKDLRKLLAQEFPIGRLNNPDLVRGLITELERDPKTDAEVTAATVAVLLTAILALPALRALLDREQWMGNLLAVIHRDGGHYLSQHGWQKACEDGETVVLKLRAENGELKERGVTRDELYDIEGKVDYECSVAGPIAVFLHSKGLLIGSPEEEGVAEDSNYE